MSSNTQYYGSVLEHCLGSWFIFNDCVSEVHVYSWIMLKLRRKSLKRPSSLSLWICLVIAKMISVCIWYWSMLVERGVNILLVGHTHDHIDKMFSNFSRQLSRCDAFTLTKLFDVIFYAYTSHVRMWFTWRRYLSDT